MSKIQTAHMTMFVENKKKRRKQVENLIFINKFYVMLDNIDKHGFF